MKRGQGTFEYVLLLGGVLLIVVLAIVVLQQTAQQSFKGAGNNQCSARLLTDLQCQSNTGSGFATCNTFNYTATYSNCAFPVNTGVVNTPNGCQPNPAVTGVGQTPGPNGMLFCGNAPV